MNVKLLLRELCQFIEVNESNPNAQSLKALASKVIFALSQNHFGAVFNRILARLQELSATAEENPDSGDIELIQHIDLDIMRLIKLLTGAYIRNKDVSLTIFNRFETIFSVLFFPFNLEINQKFRMVKKSAHLALLTSLEKAIWNWVEFHPHEFAEIQRNQNDELAK